MVNCLIAEISLCVTRGQQSPNFCYPFHACNVMFSMGMYVDRVCVDFC